VLVVPRCGEVHLVLVVDRVDRFSTRDALVEAISFLVIPEEERRRRSRPCSKPAIRVVQERLRHSILRARDNVAVGIVVREAADLAPCLPYLQHAGKPGAGDLSVAELTGPLPAQVVAGIVLISGVIVAGINTAADASADCRTVERMVLGYSGAPEPVLAIECDADPVVVEKTFRESAAACAEAHATLDSETAARVCGLESKALDAELKALESQPRK
jgi:hypothetical protein